MAKITMVARLAAGGAFHVVDEHGAALCGGVKHPATAWVRSPGAPSCSRCCVMLVRRAAAGRVETTLPIPPRPMIPRLAPRIVARWALLPPSVGYSIR